MDDLSPFYTRPRFFRGVVFFTLLLVFIWLFWADIGPGLTGWRDLLLIVLRRKAPPLDVTLGPAMMRLALNIVCYIAVYFLSMFVVAQFVLPVRTWDERKSAFYRLLLYWSKIFRGPAVFVSNGRLVNRVGEEDNTNPGVAVVDLRSAIVLEQTYRDSAESSESVGRSQKDSNRRSEISPLTLRGFLKSQDEHVVRVLGPGIRFTDWGEKIRATVDLRKQVRVAIGPPVTTKDGKQYTLPGVKAFTRDGIEVGANVSVVFSLAESPDVIPVAYWGGVSKENLHELELEKEGNIVVVKNVYRLDSDDADEIHAAVLANQITRSVGESTPSPPGYGHYPFDQERVFSAAYGQTYGASRVEWHELPLIVATDIFRNLIERYNFDYLYSVDDPEHLPWMDEFKPEFSRRVKYQGVLSYQLVRPAGAARRTGNWNVPLNIDLKERVGSDILEFSSVQPLTSKKSLRDRGIKVIVAGFAEPKIPMATREKMVERWKARWERDIQIVRARQEREAMQIISSARNQAQRDNAYFFSNLFKKEKYSREALTLLLFQALETAATDVKNRADLPPKEVLAMLQNLHRWLLIEWRDAMDRDEKGKGLSSDSSPVPGK